MYILSVLRPTACRKLLLFFFFFFNDTATTEIYTLPLHDALPISRPAVPLDFRQPFQCRDGEVHAVRAIHRSEEHTSELQSPCNLVCRLLLEKKKKLNTPYARVTLATAASPAHMSVGNTPSVTSAR